MGTEGQCGPAFPRDFVKILSWSRERPWVRHPREAIWWGLPSEGPLPLARPKPYAGGAGGQHLTCRGTGRPKCVLRRLATGLEGLGGRAGGCREGGRAGVRRARRDHRTGQPRPPASVQLPTEEHLWAPWAADPAVDAVAARGRLCERAGGGPRAAVGWAGPREPRAYQMTPLTMVD